MRPEDQPYHIILAGSSGVGKTSLFTYLRGQTSEFALDIEGDQPVILPSPATEPERSLSVMSKESWYHSVRLASLETVQVRVKVQGSAEIVTSLSN